MIKRISKWLAAAALFLPLAAHASILQFNASLSAANELAPAPNSFIAGAAGAATLFYDTVTNTYTFSLFAFGLSTATSGTVTGAHIHAQASTSQNGPVRIFLDTAPFTFLTPQNSPLMLPGTLSIGGGNVAAPVALIPAGNGNLAQSFLAVLQAGNAYVNVHTTTNGSGEIRGQLFQVAIVPELESYAMMLAGLGSLGFIARRRRTQA